MTLSDIQELENYIISGPSGERKQKKKKKGFHDKRLSTKRQIETKNPQVGNLLRNRSLNTDSC